MASVLNSIKLSRWIFSVIVSTCLLRWPATMASAANGKSSTQCHFLKCMEHPKSPYWVDDEWVETRNTYDHGQGRLKQQYYLALNEILRDDQSYQDFVSDVRKKARMRRATQEKHSQQETQQEQSERCERAEADLIPAPSVPTEPMFVRSQSLRDFDNAYVSMNGEYYRFSGRTDVLWSSISGCDTIVDLKKRYRQKRIVFMPSRKRFDIKHVPNWTTGDETETLQVVLVPDVQYVEYTERWGDKFLIVSKYADPEQTAGRSRYNIMNIARHWQLEQFWVIDDSVPEGKLKKTEFDYGYRLDADDPVVEAETLLATIEKKCSEKEYENVALVGIPSSVSVKHLSPWTPLEQRNERAPTSVLFIRLDRLDPGLNYDEHLPSKEDIIFAERVRRSAKDVLIDRSFNYQDQDIKIGGCSEAPYLRDDGQHSIVQSPARKQRRNQRLERLKRTVSGRSCGPNDTIDSLSVEAGSLSIANHPTSSHQPALVHTEPGYQDASLHNGYYYFTRPQSSNGYLHTGWDSRQITSYGTAVPRYVTPVPGLAFPRQPSTPQQFQWPSNSAGFGQILSYAQPVPSYLTRVQGFAYPIQPSPQQRPSNSVSFGQIQARKP